MEIIGKRGEDEAPQAFSCPKEILDKREKDHARRREARAQLQLQLKKIEALGHRFLWAAEVERGRNAPLFPFLSCFWVLVPTLSPLVFHGFSWVFMGF